MEMRAESMYWRLRSSAIHEEDRRFFVIGLLGQIPSF